MIVGITGTRYGLTDMQQAALQEVIGELQPDELHHGDCVGADAQACYAAFVCGVPARVAHPPTVPRWRAYCSFSTLVLPEKPYMERNKDIVTASDVMIVAPLEVTEQSAGGTWGTYRLARRACKPTIVVWPDGHVDRLGFMAQEKVV